VIDAPEFVRAVVKAALAGEKYEHENKTLVNVLHRHVNYYIDEVPDETIVATFDAFADLCTGDRVYSKFEINEVMDPLGISADHYYVYARIMYVAKGGEKMPAMYQVIQKGTALETLRAALDAQRLYARGIVHCSLAKGAKWVDRHTPIDLLSDSGHTFSMTPNAIYHRLEGKYKYTSLCPRERQNSAPHKALAHGYRWLHKEQHQCLTCGFHVRMTTIEFQRSKPCPGCDMDGGENETIWAVLDREPYCHAYVWVGRRPDWINAIHDQVDIEPVWGIIPEHAMGEKLFFQRVNPGRGRQPLDAEYFPIKDKNISGIQWADEPSDDVVRMLTKVGRLNRAKALPHAIDYIAGRDPNSRYAGIDGFLPLNTFHNAEFVRWEQGIPQYEFEVEDSPIAKALGLA